MIATHLFQSLDYFECPNKLLGQTKQAGWNIPPNLDSKIHKHVGCSVSYITRKFG